MKIQFYLGRAGTGKSRRCLDEIAERLREDPSPRGRPLILLLPEQATAQAEADLLRYPGARGFTRARILSFKRLARVILEETGGAPRDLLSETARHLILRALLVRHRGELRAFGRSAREAGFIARLAASFAELAQFRHSFDDIEAQRARLEHEGRGESLLARKLHDLALLGRAWESELGARFSNPDDFLAELARRIPHSRLFRDAEVWMDGFASFMPQEMRVIEAILKEAAIVRVALLLDPGGLDSLTASALEADPARLFSQTEETCLRLRALAVDQGIDELPPVLFPASGQKTRFSRTPPLAAFEMNLARNALISRAGAVPSFETVDGFPKGPFPPVVFVEATGRREEIEGVARAIRRFCRDEGRSYRDVAVIARDLDSYDALIRSTFARHRIPYFLDRRRGVTHHPLVELLRSSVRAVASDWPFEHVVHYLKTDFAPVERFEADRIENEALARGMRGRRWWMDAEPRGTSGTQEAQKGQEAQKEKGEEEEETGKLRRRALEPLDALHRDLLASEKPPRLVSAERFARTLQGFLDRLRCGEIVSEWAAAAREEGNLDLAEEHEQALAGIAALLEDLRQTLRDKLLSLDDLADVLDSGLQGLTLGLAPPSLDQALVGTVERSRQPNLRAAFVIGLNERVFPAAMGEDAIFSDAERRDLRDSGGFESAPPSTVKLFRERYLGYVAFTRCSEHLWLSWAAADDNGRELRPSQFVRAALEALDGPDAAMRIRLGPDYLENAVDAIELSEHAVEGVVRTRATAPEVANAASHEGRIARAWKALGRHLPEFPLEPRLEAALRARPAGNRAALDAGALVTEFGTVSASRLEAHALCPFRYFAQYDLLLREREEFQIRPLEIGSFHHALLEEVFRILRRRFGKRFGETLPGGIGETVLDWGTVPTDAMLEALNEATERCRDEFLAGGPIQSRQADFFLRRSRRQIEKVLRSMILQGADDAFVQAAAELDFGYERSPLSPLKIETSGGLPVYLRGKIDRLDLAESNEEQSGGHSGGSDVFVRIQDFKSSEKFLDLNALLGGIALQLPLYLSAMLGAGQGRLRPAGVFFVPVRRRINDVTSPPEETDADSFDKSDAVQMRGVVDGAALGLFGPLEPGESSPWVRVKLNKDGSVRDPNRSDWVAPGVLEKICGRARREAARISERIRSRRIDVQPCYFQGAPACVHCGFPDVCRVDPSVADYRVIPALRRPEIMDRILAES